jgi:hypothetical protein
LLLFRRTMSVSLHRLIRASMGSFPAAFASPSRNREYLDTFCTLCRGGHLYPWEINTLLHNRAYFPVHTSFCMGPSWWSKPITVLLRDPADPPFCKSILPYTHMQTNWRTGPPLYTMEDPIGRPIRTPGALPYTVWVDRSGWPLQSIIDQLASLSPLYYRQPGRNTFPPFAL